MPYIAEQDKRYEQSFTGYKPVEDAEAWEVIGAAAQQAFDEGMTISSSLNRQGFDNRAELVRKKAESGIIPRDVMDKFTFGRNSVDYDGLSLYLNDPEIKSDRVLEEERSKMLAERRAYSEDILQRGGTVPALFGSLAAYSLDPLNVATMGISTPFVAAKGLSVLARTARGAIGTAGISAGTEALIQPFVYQHKQAIDSPYAFNDALEQIAYAALGGGVIGGTAHGIGGYLSKVKGAVEAIDRPLTMAEKDALDSVSAMMDDLADVEPVTYKGASLDNAKAVMLKEIAAEIEPRLASRLDDADVASMKTRLDDLTKSAESGNKKAAKEIKDIEKALRLNDDAIKAADDFELVKRGELPPSKQQELDGLYKKQVDAEKTHLAAINDKMSHINTVREKVEKPRVQVQSGEKFDRVQKAHEETLRKFQELPEGTIIAEVDGKLSAVNGAEYIKQVDKEKSVYEKVRACFLG